MQQDPLHTRDMVLIAVLVAIAIFAFVGAVSAISNAKPKFIAPPVVALS